MSIPPIVWTIAGTDPGGGAGIQGDLKTFQMLGAHGCSVITAVIAQNTLGVQRVEPVNPDLVGDQLASLEKDLPPAAVKIGMLGSAGAVRAVTAVLERLRVFTVYDPVMSSSGGHELIEPEAVVLLKSSILPHVGLLTPNIPEAERLCGHSIHTEYDMEEAARALVGLGVASVLLKGGHHRSPWCQDYWTDGKTGWWLNSPRRDVDHTHGTGCTLSSAIAVFHAAGINLADSITLGKAYVNQGMREGGGIGHGRGPLRHGGWPSNTTDLPWITDTPWINQKRMVFPPEEELGNQVYPLVDRASWMERLLPVGVRVIQLRVKDLNGKMLENEIRKAIDLARRFDAHLYINDYWDLALKHGAYGVHLGQDDLAPVDWSALARAGMRLGISTHNYFEIARATSVIPSYVAIGSVYPTTSKSFPYSNIGLDRFRQLRALLEVPVVAIGGITLENAAALRAAGADGMAVISDICSAQYPEQRVVEWAEFLKQR